MLLEMLKLESIEEEAAAILRHLINSKETFEYDEAKEAASAYEVSLLHHSDPSVIQIVANSQQVLSPSIPEGVETTNVNAELLMHLACGIREGELPDPVMEEASYILFIENFCELYAYMKAEGLPKRREAIRIAHRVAFAASSRSLPPATVVQDVEADRRRLLLLVEQCGEMKNLAIQALKAWMLQGRDYFPSQCNIAPGTNIESMPGHCRNILDEKDYDTALSRMNEVLHVFYLHNQAPLYQVIKILESERDVWNGIKEQLTRESIGRDNDTEEALARTLRRSLVGLGRQGYGLQGHAQLCSAGALLVGFISYFIL
ncbi:hypothetical protein AUP68_03218 [Ilyonectria robusta]